jgi:hypothetical protein
VENGLIFSKSPRHAIWAQVIDLSALIGPTAKLVGRTTYRDVRSIASYGGIGRVPRLPNPRLPGVADRAKVHGDGRVQEDKDARPDMSVFRLRSPRSSLRPGLAPRGTPPLPRAPHFDPK